MLVYYESVAYKKKRVLQTDSDVDSCEVSIPKNFFPRLY